MSMSAKQAEFTVCIGRLIEFATEQGYRLSFGDAYRDPRVHGFFGEKRTYSAARSVHKLRLAVDFNLFVRQDDGKWMYIIGTEPHRPLGEYWESLHEDARWGGRWNDGNHYSFTHMGAA